MQKKPDASHHPDGVPAFGASLNRNKPHKAAWIEQAFHTGQETKNMLKSYVTFDPFMPIDPIYHRFRASQFSGVILICFLGEERRRDRAGIDLSVDEESPSHEMVFRLACRTVERPRQKQAEQAPSGNRGAACQRVPPEVHREALQFFACQPRKLAEEAQNQKTEAVKSYGGFGTFA